MDDFESPFLLVVSGHVVSHKALNLPDAQFSPL